MGDRTPPNGTVMVQPCKKRAMINWINSIGLAECIESIHQLRDGRHLCLVLSAIDQDVQMDGSESIEDRINFIKKFLETQYKTQMAGKINFNLIKNGHEFEIGKLTLLLLCAGLICTGNELFVESAVKLDTNDQLEIRDMAGTILTQNNDLESIEGDWYNVLTRPGDFNADMPPRTPTSAHVSTFSTSMMQASADSSILSRFASPSTSRYTPANGSPVMQFVRSPSVANRILIQKKELKIKQLQRELNSERHLRSEFESEIKVLKEETIMEKESLIRKLENKIKILRRQTLDLQVQADQVDGVERERNELASTLELKSHKLNELKDAQNQLQQLQRENEELYLQVDSLKSQIRNSDSSRAEVLKLRNYSVELEGNAADLKMNMSAKNTEIAELRESFANIEVEMLNLQELHRQEISDMRKGNDTGNFSMAGECLNGVIEKELREQLEDLEEEISCLKAQLVSQMQKHKVEKQGMLHKEGDLQQHVQQLNQQIIIQTQKLSSVHSQFLAKSEELEETKQLLETENIHLQDALEESRGRHNETLKSVNDLSSRLNVLSEQNNTLQDSAEKAQSEFSSQVEAMMDQRDQLQGELADRDTALDEHIETSHQKSVDLGDIKKEKEKLEGDIESFSQKMEDLQDQVDALEEERDDIHLKCQEQESRLEQLQQTVDIAESERTEWQQKALELEEQISMNRQSSNEKIQTFQAELQQARARNSYFENLVGNFEGKVCQLEEGFKQNIEKAEKGKETLVKELASSRSRAEKIQEAFEMSKKKMSEMEKRVAFYHDGVLKLEEEMKKSHAESSNKHSGLQEQLAELNRRLVDSDSTLNKAKKEKKSFISQYEEEKSRSVQLEQALIQTENQVQDLEDELRRTKCTLTNIQEDLNTTHAQVNDTDTRHQEELRAAHTRENQLQTDLTQAQEFVNEVKVELEELQKNLPGELATTRDKNRHLKRKLDENSKEFTVLKKRCDELEKEKGAQQEYLESSQSNVTKVWNELQDSQQEVNELKSSLESSQEDNQRLWNEISEIKKEHEAITSQHVIDVERITTLESCVHTAQDRLEAKLAKSREEVALLEENLIAERSRAATFEEEVQHARSSSSELEGQLKTELKEAYAKEQELEECNDQYNDDINRLEEIVEESSSKILKLEGHLQTISHLMDEKVAKVASLESKLIEKEQDAKSSASQLQNKLEEQLKESLEKEKQLEQSVQTAHGDLSEIEKRLNTAVSDNTSLLLELKASNVKISEKECALSDMEHQLREAVSRSKNVENDMKVSHTEVSSELKSSKDTIAALGSNVEAAEEALKAQAKAFEDKEGDMEFELLAAKSEAEEKSKELQQLVENFEAFNGEVQSRETNFQSILTNNEGVISKLKQQITNEMSNVKDLETELQVAKEKAAVVARENADYKTQLSTVNQSIEVTSNLSNTFKTQLEDREKTCKTMESEVSLYKERVEKLEAELQSSKKSDENYRGATDSLQGALSQLQTRLHNQEEAYRILEESSKTEREELITKYEVSETKSKELQKLSEDSTSTKQGKLKKKVEELTARSTKLEDAHKKKLAVLEVDFRQRYEKEATRWKESMEQVTASCKRARERLEGKEQEYGHLKVLADKYKADCGTKGSLVEQQTSEINTLRLQLAERIALVEELKKTQIAPAGPRPALRPPPSPTSSIGSTLSSVSKNQMVPAGLGQFYQIDEEPELMPEFGCLADIQRRNTGEQEGWNHETGRLSELQRRNTLCLPHLKTSYPVETQMRAPTICTDDKLKHGQSPIIEEDSAMSDPVSRSRLSSGSSSLQQSQPVYTPSATTEDRFTRKRTVASAGITSNESPDGPSEKRQQIDGTVVKLSTPGVNMYKAYTPRTRAQMRAAGLLNSGHKPMLPIPAPFSPVALTGLSDLAIGSPTLTRKAAAASPTSVTSIKSTRGFGKKKSPSKENLTFNIGFTPLRSARKIGKSIFGKRLKKGSKSKHLTDNNVPQK